MNGTVVFSSPKAGTIDVNGISNPKARDPEDAVELLIDATDLSSADTLCTEDNAATSGLTGDGKSLFPESVVIVVLSAITRFFGGKLRRLSSFRSRDF